LSAELARIAPSEILVPDAIFENGDLLHVLEEVAQFTPLGAASFDSTSAEKRICELFKVNSLDAYGAFGRAELSVLGALVDYVAITQKGALPHISPPQREQPGTAMRIDAATRRNLELSVTLVGERQGSLLATIDRTFVTIRPCRKIAVRRSRRHQTSPALFPVCRWVEVVRATWRRYVADWLLLLLCRGAS